MKQELIEKAYKLDQENGNLAYQIEEIDYLLRQIGFPEGIASLKQVAQEILEDEQSDVA